MDETNSAKQFADLPIEPVKLQIKSINLPAEPVSLPPDAAESVVTLDRLPKERIKARKKQSAKKQNSGV